MSELPRTENGDNWSVFFFECPTERLKKVLVDLFRYVGEVKEAKIPHFLVREYFLAKHLGISLRVLRKASDAKKLDDKLVDFFEKQKLRYDREPKGNRHAWIREGKINPDLHKGKCEALHKLSNFVAFLAQNDIFDAHHKCHNVHYLVNMLALQEATTLGSNQMSYYDLIEGKALRFQTLQLRPPP